MQKLSLNDIVDVLPMTLNYFEGNPSIRYHVVTPEEAEERKKDTSWHLIHCFMRGYSWFRNSDNIYVSNHLLYSLKIEFKDFPNLPVEKIDEIVNKIKEDNEKERKFREENPIKPFGELKFPKFSDSELDLIKELK
jgi:hypothetical protein